MTTDTKYNGWTNYETWNVALHLDNDEQTYTYWRAVASECYEEAEADEILTRKERASQLLADRLKDEIEDGAPDLGCSLYSDLLAAAIQETNWDEIASNWLEDVDED